MKRLYGVILVLIIGVLSACTTEVDVVEYQVVYETFGGTIIETQVFKKGAFFELPPVPEKEGYVFEQWFLDEELSVPYERVLTVTTDMNLYAKWIPMTTTVFLSNGNRVLDQFTITYGEELVIPELSAYGYTFEGWFLESTFEHEVTTVTGTSENQTVYVQFTKNPIVIPTEGDIDLTLLPYYEYLSSQNPVVTITVESIGVMTLELFPSVAQNTVDNFIGYIQNNSYSGSAFHRVIEDFMIQGGIVESRTCPISGDFSTNGFTNDLLHYRGVISMARTNDPDSATSQFFIVHKDSFFLDGSYATFGGLTSGFNVLDYIASVSTNYMDAPLSTIVIESITIELNGYEVQTVVCAP